MYILHMHLVNSAILNTQYTKYQNIKYLFSANIICDRIPTNRKVCTDILQHCVNIFYRSQRVIFRIN